MAKKTWQEKFHNGQDPKVVVLDEPYGALPAGATLLISSPAEIDGYVRDIPFGTTVSPVKIREDLAAKHGAAATCPLTTGIFLRIAAECALAEVAAGKSEKDVTPFWRAIDPKSPLAQKLSCGAEIVESLRDAERTAKP